MGDKPKIIYATQSLAFMATTILRYEVADVRVGKTYATLVHLNGSRERLRNEDVHATFDEAAAEAGSRNDKHGEWIAEKAGDLKEARDDARARRVRVVRREPQAPLSEEDLAR